MIEPRCCFFRAILHELGLQGRVTTEQLSKKWDNMKRRYKVRRRRCSAHSVLDRK